jgi:uncharacterized membrane protein YcaP (DUF421 family)
MDSVIRALAIYAALLVVTRLSGRRTLAQVSVFDFVLLLILAETASQGLLGDDSSITNSILVFVTLALTDVVLAYLKSFSPRLGVLIDGTQTVLISGGRLDEKALSRARVGIDEILESARASHGLARLDQIDCAVLEISGGISIIPKRP